MTEAFGSFAFGLSPEQEARAARIHEESVIVDLLYWGPLGYRSYSDEMVDAVKTSYATGGFAAATATVARRAADLSIGDPEGYRALWDASGVTGGSRDLMLDAAFPASLAGQIAQFDRLPWLIKALKAADFRRAKTEGKHAGFLNTQIFGALTLELVESAWWLGLRMLMLAYNTMNPVASGCTERTDAGVSSFGAKVITLMNDLGMIVDTAHCGRRTTLDACELSAAPVVASHSFARALYQHDRGKGDEELRAVAATGGVVGVVTVPFFLGNNGTTIETMLDHIDYIAGLVGWQHVAIGTDWPLGFPKFYLSQLFSPAMVEPLGFREEHGIQPDVNLIGFDDYRDFRNITRGLVKRGYTDEQVKGVLGENFLRVFEKVCG